MVSGSRTPTTPTPARLSRASVDLQTTPISVSSSSPSPFRPHHVRIQPDLLQTTPISVSSSSPSPSPSLFHPQRVPFCPQGEGNIFDLTDSESSDIRCMPIKRRKVVKCEQLEHTSPLAAVSNRAEKRQWPSDYPVVDVVHVLHSCKPPPPHTTISRHFSSLTGIPFKSSTYYDAWSRWVEATQEQRDNAEQCGIWKNFMAQVPLKKTKVKVARQRVLRHQCTASTEGNNGSEDDELSPNGSFSSD